MPRLAKSRSPRNKKSSGQSNTLRIIGGQWRGRKVPFPDAEGLRPTSDRVRETLFNWLAPIINGARCLDLYSGSGALSFEALSRGADQVVLVDASSKVSQQLRQNLATLGCSNAQVLNQNALNWLKSTQPQGKTFDLVFLDPPFNQQLVTPTCELLESQGLIAEGGYVYIETEVGLPLQLPDNWHIHREKNAGQVAYYLCIREAAEE